MISWLGGWFDWKNLSFENRLKIFALFVQAGSGVVMTLFSAWALYHLTVFKAIWPVFYLGAGALLLIGIIVTGLAGLLIKRTVEIDAFGAKLKSIDQAAVALTEAVSTMKEHNDVQRTD